LIAFLELGDLGAYLNDLASAVGARDHREPAREGIFTLYYQVPQLVNRQSGLLDHAGLLTKGMIRSR
jgi:hypothetical protein